MKLRIVNAVFLTGLLLSGGLSSCQREAFEPGQGDDGYVQLSCTHDPLAVTVTKAGEEPVYAVQFVNSRGNVSKSFANHTEINGPVKLKADTYTIRLNSGAQADAAFDAPYYAGETTIKVLSGQNNEASVVCQLANTKVSVGFSDVIRANFTSFTVTVSNGEAGMLIYGENEQRAGYLKTTGLLKWTIHLENQNGTPFEMVQTIRDVKPRQHYKLLFDVDQDGDPTNGGITTNIDVDESTNEHKHDIDIILNKKSKPQISGSGFDITAPVQVALGHAIGCEVGIFAEAKINELRLMHTSNYLASVGIPESFSLVDASADVKAVANAQGITWSEPVGDAQSARISLSELTGKLPLGNHDIRVSVLDAQNQLVEQTVQFVVIPDVEVTTVNATQVWAKFATLNGKWNTLERPAGIGFVYKKQSDEQWTTLGEDQLTVAGSDFFVQLTGLEPSTAYQVRAFSATEDGANTVTFTTDAAEMLPNMNLDEWSNDNTPGGKWGSGNNTFAKMTKKETSVVRNGNAVRMTSAEAAGMLAAGNLFTGSFGGIIMTPSMGGKLNFGTPYTGRPTSMSGYYNYLPETVGKYAKAPYTVSGQADFCHIYVILTTWTSTFEVNTVEKKFINLNDPSIIAYGEFTTDQNSGGYQPFHIDIEYRDDRKPSYIVVVATSSRYGDYFSGAVGSTLYIDDLDFGFDAPVTWKK